MSYWSGQNTHMKVNVFRNSMLHSVTFFVTILCYCARYLSRNCYVQDTAMAARYAATAERILEDYMQQEDAQDDNIVMALTALSLQEERYGSKEKSRRYMSSAMQRLKPHVGKFPGQEPFLHFVQYITAEQNMEFQTDEALQLRYFLHNAEALSVEHSQTQFLAQVPRRKSLFEYTTPLHLLLSSGPHPTPMSETERRWIIKTESLAGVCRTAALLLITSTLCDMRYSADKCNRYLDKLITTTQERGFHRRPATESFLWMLLEEPYDEDLKNPWRAWLVGNLLRSSKKLPPFLRFQFDELLLSYLMLKTPDFGFSSMKFEGQLWGHLGFEREG